jgi:hypothetical protein
MISGNRSSEMEAALTALAVLSIYIALIAVYSVSDDTLLLYLATALTFVVAVSNTLVTKDIFHPFSIIPFVHGMYAILPIGSAGEDGDRVLAMFGVGGGAIVFDSATFGIIVAWVIYCAYGRRFSTPRSPMLTGGHIPASIPWILLIVGAALTISFFVIVGFDQFASMGYLDRFEVRLEAGMGIYTAGALALVTISLCIFISRPKIDYVGVGACIAVFALDFAGHGSRYYFIAPALTCAAAYNYRVRRIPALLTVTFGTALYFVFDFVGYLRLLTDDGAVSNTSASVSGYLTYLSTHLGQIEMAPVYGTASAAYLGFVKPLPYFGDYLQAWQMSLPQFLVPLEYLPANVRFALEFDLTSETTKMGWGFSLFGEAYLVMGIFGPALLASSFCALAMSIYSNARARGNEGLAGALWFSLITFEIVAQRNALAFFIKDWVVYQAIPMALIGLYLKMGRPPIVLARQLNRSNGAAD